jgi:hypothetical protein
MSPRGYKLGYIITTEVGYDVYLEAYQLIASVVSYGQALAVLDSEPLWNGRINRAVSSYMPCQ